jgi:hypothetical protein
VLPVAGAAEGDALTELLGLNKPPNLPGDADAAGLTTGLAAAAASVFLRPRFGLGEATGDSPTAGDAGFSVGETVAAAFLDARCFFAGEGDSMGD